MKPLPEGVAPYSRTPSFTAETTPAALRADHATKPGVWGVIMVEAGRVTYAIPSTGERHDLVANRPGIVEPEVRHRVTPSDDARFFVEFHR